MFCFKCENILNIGSDNKIINQDVKTTEEFLKFYDKNKNDLSYSVKSDFTHDDLDELLTSKKSKNKKKILDYYDTVQNVKKNNYNLLCNNCESVFILKPKTILYKISYISKNKNIDLKYDIDNLINNQILPRTKNYICQNSSCTTHNDLINKEAIIYRIDDTFKTYYICTICKDYWNPLLDTN
jgi:hypothetical protein